ncbi:hypothetical protein E8E13_008193 [Curvularia kusanoi]|uniref:Uncharacterized protein n=1 Tax=Curvularia kusanoi TaxID=90978 RepID=A0A9P4TJJ4_CURKU|nr:hypothetical protein E8E13_008193 [Curvularia kusanoi]
MSNYQYSSGHPKATHYLNSLRKNVPPVVTAGPGYDRRDSSSSDPPSSGSSASFYGYAGYSAVPGASSSSQDRRIRMASVSQQPQGSAFGHHVATRADLTSADTSSIGPQASNMALGYHRRRGSTLTGVPESVSVQEMALRQAQRDINSHSSEQPPNPFDKEYDQLWATFYQFGKEYGIQRRPTPAAASLHNFAWPVLINPYSQSLEHPNGTLDPSWSRKMIEIALNCMQELIRVTCRRKNGWEKTVADIPLPAQEALAAFPDLAERYTQLKRDAREARGGGRPQGY